MPKGMPYDLSQDEVAALRAYAECRRADLTADQLGQARNRLGLFGLVRDCPRSESPMYVAVTPLGRQLLAGLDEPEPDDGHQACSNCGERVYTVSTRGWCDGCEEEAER